MRIACAAVLVAAGAAQADDGAAQWYMDGANAGRTSCVDVEPVRSAPTELWRRKPDEGCIAEPVAWNGVLYTLSQVKSGAQILTAFDVRNGLLLARAVRMKRIGGTGRLAVWKDMVVVVEPGQTEAYSFKGNGLYSKWSRIGSTASPCLVGGAVLAGQYSFDLATGDALTLTNGFEAAYQFGSISAASVPGDRALLFCAQLGSHGQYAGTWLRGQTVGLARCSAGVGTMKADGKDASVPLAIVGKPDSNTLPDTYPIRLDAPGPQEPGAWILDGPQTLSTTAGKTGRLVLHVDKGVNELLPGVGRPAVVAGVAYTFDETGELIAIHADGRAETIAAAAALPEFAAKARLTAAKGTLCTPCWGFDLAERRVAWTFQMKSGETALGPAIPVGPGLLAVRTQTGEIVCLADPQRPQTAPAKPSAPAAAKPAAPTMPVAGDGVLLRDGRQVLGQTQLHGVDGGVIVVGADGSAQEFARDEILVAESGGSVLMSGSEAEVHRVWDAALRAAIVPRLESIVGIASEVGLRTQGAGWIELARKWGLPESRVAELTKKLPRSDVQPVDPKMRGLEKRAAPLLDTSAAELLRAAEWCGTRGFPAAGALLAARTRDLDRGRVGIDAAEKLVPQSLRTCLKDSVSGAAWIRWAEVLLAADASVLEPNDPAWGRVAPEWWTPAQTLGFRAKNLLFFSRETDPAIVGPCLSRGEAAVRGLHQLLGVADPLKPTTDDERLLVLLHKYRSDYLKEAGPGGDAIAGTAGYFSPAENVSRFYVPEPGSPGAKDLARSLFKVLAHELTHHYVEARWAPSLGPPRPVDRSLLPGFWIVEGIAQFMGDQIVESDSRGLTFEDPSVLSVTLTAALEKKDGLIPLGTLVDMDQRRFAALGEEPVYPVIVARTSMMYKMSAKNVFYEQSATLSFFLRNARGDDGRRAFVEYLRRFYTGTATGNSWRVLGFETAQELHSAFTEWLRSLK